MSKMIFHPADSRGKADHGWLQSFHSFSFGHYHNPERVHFGALRVLNDDTVQGGLGFGTHPHKNMEIISIPLEGDLEHQDSMGNLGVIRQGDIQVMSAGSGITHSEYNKNKDRVVKFLQIWIIPNQQNVSPRYDQISLQLANRQNQLQQILSPSADDQGVWIHQNAWFHLGQFEAGKSTQYSLKDASKNGVYAFVINGSFSVNNQPLHSRDGLGIWEVSQLDIESLSADSEILLMEVPMEF